MTVDQALQAAIQHHQSGQLREAEQLYRQILTAQPDHADALHLLGVLAGQAGQHAAGAELIQRAIALAPGNRHYVSNLGINLHQSAKFDQAIECFKTLLNFTADDATVHFAIGNVYRDQRQPLLAAASYEKSLAINPRDWSTNNNLGNVLQELHRLDDAIDCYQRALSLSPNNPEVHYNLGNALRDKGEMQLAIFHYQAALSHRPGYIDAHNNLGIVLKSQGDLAGAISAYEKALAIAPHSPLTLNNLGSALAAMGRLDEANNCYHRAITLQPAFTDALVNLGNALSKQGKLDEAIDSYQLALGEKPDDATVLQNLGNAWKDKADIPMAIDCYRKAMQARPHSYEAHSCLLLAMNYQSGVTPGELLEESLRWVSQHSAAHNAIQHANDRDPHRRLRIGYVSPDLSDHPVGRFIAPLLAGHDRARFEIFCYAQVLSPDETTRRLQSYADHWRNIVGQSDQQVFDLIGRDRIDLLVDLAGHTADNRLLLFARKPAPVQVSCLGYPATTGLTAIDYRLTDDIADPPEHSDAYYTEQLIRLPSPAWCFSPPGHSPPLVDPPAVQNGLITFGSFNNFAKITDQTLQMWSQILQTVPNSKLLMRSRGLQSPSIQQQIRRSLNSDRIEFHKPDLIEEYLQRYSQIDIALDPFPYNGTTTTCESLWMGVPVVTLAGDRHASRVSASLLTSIGLPNLVADSPPQYVKIAADLAGDVPLLTALRAGMRERMRQSPLMDSRRFSARVEAAYQEMWQRWCARPR